MALSRNSSVYLLIIKIVVVLLVTTLFAAERSAIVKISKIVQWKSNSKTCLVYNLKTRKQTDETCKKISYPYYLKTEKTCRKVISKKISNTAELKYCKITTKSRIKPSGSKALSINQQKDRVVEITSSKTKTCKVMSKKGLFADYAIKCSTLSGIFYQRLQQSCHQVDGKKTKKLVEAKMCDTKNAKARFTYRKEKCIASWKKPAASLIFESQEECSISMTDSKFDSEKNSKSLMVMQPLNEKFKCKLIRKSGKTVLESTSCRKTLRRYFLRTSKGCMFSNFNTNEETNIRNCDTKSQAYYIHQNPTTKLCEYAWGKAPGKTMRFSDMTACQKKLQKDVTTSTKKSPVVTTMENEHKNVVLVMKPSEIMEPSTTIILTLPPVILTTTKPVTTTTTPKLTTTTKSTTKTTKTTTLALTTKKLDPADQRRKADANFAQCCQKNVAMFTERCLKKNICRYDVTEAEFLDAYATTFFGKVIGAGVCPSNSVKTYRSCASNQRDFPDCCSPIVFQSEAERKHCPRSCSPFSSIFPTDVSSLLEARVCNKHQSRMFQCFRQKLYQV